MLHCTGMIAPLREPPSKTIAHFWVALIRTCPRGANDFYGTASIRTLSSSSASLLQLCSRSKYALCNSGSFVWSANSLQRAAYCLHSLGSPGPLGIMTPPTLDNHCIADPGSLAAPYCGLNNYQRRSTVQWVVRIDLLLEVTGRLL
jgi:hypothetical protein